jgi:hypothetical protein
LAAFAARRARKAGARGTARPAHYGAALLAVLALLAPTTALTQSAPGGGRQAQAAAPAAAGPAGDPVPLLAYYYIWFDPSSWNRAKTDYPSLGRYSSDDPKVIAQQIRWARSAGIEGFIVSWKDTPVNDRRLTLLMSVATRLHFKLAMIYQGLDFSRKPLPASRVAADLRTFADRYAPDPVFLRLGGKPLTVWSGTWAYSHPDVAAATAPVRDRILVLNTEKSLSGYHRIADATDGDAYYWSSVNPATNHDYRTKLDALAQAVHQEGKYWLAPFAPGFDARLVGGGKTVPRDGGSTLRTEYAAAIASSPDVLGLISWNEFSENSYVEPSQKYGMRYLDTLRSLRNAPVPPAPPGAGDSSEPAHQQAGASAGASATTLALAAVAAALCVLVGGALLLRRRRQNRS